MFELPILAAAEFLTMDPSWAAPLLGIGLPGLGAIAGGALGFFGAKKANKAAYKANKALQKKIAAIYEQIFSSQAMKFAQAEGLMRENLAGAKSAAEGAETGLRQQYSQAAQEIMKKTSQGSAQAKQDAINAGLSASTAAQAAQGITQSAGSSALGALHSQEAANIASLRAQGQANIGAAQGALATLQMGAAQQSEATQQNQISGLMGMGPLVKPTWGHNLAAGIGGAQAGFSMGSGIEKQGALMDLFKKFGIGGG
mgnify:CR=1 FL=1